MCPYKPISYFYWLFEAFDQDFMCAKDLLHVNDVFNFQSILNHLEFCWYSLVASKYQNSLVAILGLHKVMEVNSEHFPKTKSVVSTIYQAMEIGTLKLSLHFWKRMCAISIKNPEISKQVNQFKLLDEQINIWNFNNSGNSFNLEWFTTVPVDAKKLIIEGVSTLISMDINVKHDRKLCKTISEVIAEYKFKKETLSSIGNITATKLSEVASKLSSLLSWPFYDLECVISEIELVSNIASLLVKKENYSSMEDMRVIIELSKSILEKGVSKSSFNPLHFETLQRIVWYMESSQDYELVSDFLGSAVMEFISRLNMVVWSNSHSFLMRCLNDKELEPVVSGSSLPFIVLAPASRDEEGPYSLMSQEGIFDFIFLSM
jgi:hypothetical protein